jgi:hypothetical protein
VEDEGLRVMNMSNLKLVFLPPNITSVAQPLHQGIIAAWNVAYRRALVEWVLDEANKPGNQEKTLKDVKPNFYQMMRWAHKAWTVSVTPCCIQSCWHKAGILPESMVPVPPASRSECRRIAAAEHCVLAPSDQTSPEDRPDEQAERCNAADSAAVSGIVDVLADSASEKDTLERLDGALLKLAAVAREKGWVAEDEELVQALDYIELDGEDEVFEAMTDDEIVWKIVQMVDTQGTDDADSNEDEADDCQACKITTAQAMGLAAELHDFVLSHPDQFVAEQADVLQGLQRQMAKMCLADKRQTYMTSIFGAKLKTCKSCQPCCVANVGVRASRGFALTRSRPVRPCSTGLWRDG